MEQAIKSNLSEATTKILSTLTPREERVLRMRFGVGMNTDHTLRGSGITIFCNKGDELDRLKLKHLRKLETSK